MKKVFVIDTSVLIHNPRSIFSFDDNEVVIPLAALEEIERRKSHMDDTGEMARQLIRHLDALRASASLAGGVPLPGGGTLRIELNHRSETEIPIHYQPGLPANRILLVTLNLARDSNCPVILVTKDLAMRVKADAFGIQAEDYYNDRIEEQNGSKLEFDLADHMIDALYQTGEVEVPEALTANLGVEARLQDGTILPLLSSRDGKKLLNPHFRVRQNWGIVPKNQEQTWAFELLANPEIRLVNLMGPAGTGKTLLALASGLEQTVHQGIYRRVLCARPVVPLGREIGYLPGEKEDKVRPYMQPIYDNLEFLLRPGGDRPGSRDKDKDSEAMIDSAIDLLRKKRQLEVEVLTYIRGRSIAGQFLIIDEAQNLTVHEIKTIITRAGEGTKVILCGDPDQIDNPYLDKYSHGLAHVSSRLRGQPFYGEVRLVKGERSQLADRAAALL